ncbi:putative transposase YbfD/YdcC [Allofrancisella inopinata]|uniref:ISAs1 family transposase n=1 Tax=Allofrancisella inopinata TaxID=1085647 RepID=A0AAE7CRG8_9GAMM|nr:ISAs1 family transposase [Allofrancisella inopinata]TDT74592.1 putative transposase YbfD/YdcC [Allofrancisella inopinata]
MSTKATASIFHHFEQVSDPRINRKKRHKLIDIFFMTITAVICGANNWVMIEEFCKSKEEWLNNILDLENGIPSHDTFGRVFAALNTQEFIECFNQWMKDI